MPKSQAESIAQKEQQVLRLFSTDPLTFRLEPAAASVRNDDIVHQALDLVVGPEGENYGAMSKEEALNKAKEAGLDLVLVSEAPPRAKITDYSKWAHEQSKKRKALKKSQQQSRVKQVRFGAFAEEHDIDTKFDRVVRFLEQGKQVRVSVFFKRPRDFDQETAEATLDYLKEELEPHGTCDAEYAVTVGRAVAMGVNPKKKG